MAVAPYRLKPHAGEPREGALLKVQFADGIIGYADCHPWKEFGDGTLEDQLDWLKKWDLTPLLIQSLGFARMDAEARAEKRWLFEGAAMPQSHWSLPRWMAPGWQAEVETAAEAGCEIVKMKVSRDELADDEYFLKVAGKCLNLGMGIAIDFNGKVSAGEAIDFVEAVSWEAPIVWLEDPCHGHEEQWLKVKTATKCKLARDFSKVPSGFDFEVVKPAVVDYPAHLKGLPLIVTSYLDHPLGQLTAAWKAVHLGQTHKLISTGLISHVAYETTPFAERFEIRKGRLVPPEGTGFGFDEELESLEWTDL